MLFRQFGLIPFLFYTYYLLNNGISAADRTFVRLHGSLLDDQGNAIPDGKLQIWQADSDGLYEKMLSPDEQDSNFQYFGTATSDADGKFSFSTLRPGLYPARPVSHFHFRIFIFDQLKLTTQYYFADENPPYDSSLLMDLEADADGGFSTMKNFTVNMGGGGSEPLTISQPAGPYYPSVNFFDVGSDLILSNSTDTNSPSMSSAAPEAFTSTFPSVFPSSASDFPSGSPSSSSTFPSVSPPSTSVSPTVSPSSASDFQSVTPSSTSVFPSVSPSSTSTFPNVSPSSTSTFSSVSPSSTSISPSISLVSTIELLSKLLVGLLICLQ